MPTLKQNLNVLKNGVQRRGTRDNAANFSLDQTLPMRDHYERWAQYYKRQYPKRKQTPWADTHILDQAVAAARDTPMGIVDTVTREYITYWMPEIMLFVLAMDDNESDDGQTHLLTYKSLANGVRRNVLDVIRRVNCRCEVARKLATTLKEKAEHRLSKLFVVFEDLLTDEEKREYDPAQAKPASHQIHQVSHRLTKTAPESIPEARILNSSLAWGLSDSRIQRDSAQNQPKIPSPKKRKYSEMGSSPGPDPADNGQVWDSPKLDFKRQKFEFTFTSAVQLPQTGEYTLASPHRVGGRSRQQYDTVDLTEDGDDDDDDGPGHATSLQDGFHDSTEFRIPGSLSSQPKDGQCILM